MGRAARNNPTAVAAKKGELPPKVKSVSKREQERRLQAHVRELLAKVIADSDSLKSRSKEAYNDAGSSEDN